MHSAKKQKVSSFYSKSLPRPALLLDDDNNPVKNRVDAPPPVTGALLEWAKRAPLNKGGARPVFKGAPAACLTAFGALVQDKRKQLLQDREMHDYYKADSKALQADARSSALKEWKLLDEEHRADYQERAAADQLRWEKEVEVYEKTHPHYRSYLAQKHVKKLNDKGVIDIQLAQLGIKKPLNARHFYIKEQVEKRLKEDENLALEYTATDLFEGTSIDKRHAWLDMPDDERAQYNKQAEEDKKRFDAQLQAHPKLAGLIEAYEQKKKDLRAAKKSTASKGSKKRRRGQEEAEAADEEGPADAAQGKGKAAGKSRTPLAELPTGEKDESSAMAVDGAGTAAQQGTGAVDEPVSDTDDEDEEGVAGLGGDLLETVQETQNDEEEQALPGSQGATLKQRLGMQKFGSFIAGLFTAKKPIKRGAGVSGQTQHSQSPAPAASQEADDMPPIQNTLDTQPASQKEEEAGDRAVPGSGPAPAPAGAAANTPQLPQQSLVAKLNEAAETEPIPTEIVPTEAASIAFVTTPGLVEGIQTSAGAAEAGPSGKADTAGKAGSAAAVEDQTAADQAGKAADDSRAEQPTDAVPPRTRTSRAAKAAATAKLTTASGGKSGGRAEDRRKSSGGNAGSKASAESAPAEEASHMAEKEPHSRVDEIKGVKGSSPKQDSAGAKQQQEPAEKRDPLIGRCIKKDFETDNGVQTYTGWIIGKHESRKWYAVQYEDGDKEEFELSELRKKKLLQPVGPHDKTDFEELERMYNAAKAEWAAEEEAESAK